MAGPVGGDAGHSDADMTQVLQRQFRGSRFEFQVSSFKFRVSSFEVRGSSFKFRVRIETPSRGAIARPPTSNLKLTMRLVAATLPQAAADRVWHALWRGVSHLIARRVQAG